MGGHRVGGVQASKQHATGNCAQTACPVGHLERHTPRLEDRSPGDPQVLISSSIKVSQGVWWGSQTSL